MYSFLGRQTGKVRQTGKTTVKVIWYSLLFNIFPQFVVIYTFKGFIIVNEAEVDIFLAFPCMIHFLQKKLVTQSSILAGTPRTV